ncbi:hypothetical protein B0H16DRAFT_1693361 [Mycena metata]|uniref:Uncharacterized protein n=1 Tax=Mycena metata TaxID=1033252 RepID=A0AAD7IIN6_9AGAR|nr:hypothetical protein B0H16DRAFT_1693361 [Mycena metata]
MAGPPRNQLKQNVSTSGGYMAASLPVQLGLQLTTSWSPMCWAFIGASWPHVSDNITLALHIILPLSAILAIIAFAMKTSPPKSLPERAGALEEPRRRAGAGLYESLALRGRRVGSALSKHPEFYLPVYQTSNKLSPIDLICFSARSARSTPTPISGQARSQTPRHSGESCGESKKVVRAFRSVLEADQAKLGQKTFKGSDMEDKIDEFQQMVDNIIDIGAMDATTSTQDQPGGV